MRETVWSAVFATHTEPSPTANGCRTDADRHRVDHLVRGRVDDGDGVRLDARAAVRAPAPNAKTGMATAAASTPISAAPTYMRRRLRLSSTSSVFSWPNSLGRPSITSWERRSGTVDVLEPTLAEVANRDARRQLVLDELPRRPREQHLAAVARRRRSAPPCARPCRRSARRRPAARRCAAPCAPRRAAPSGQACAARSR